MKNTTKPIGVLILSGVRGDTRRYRTFHLYEQLRLVGIPAILSHVTDPKLPEYINYAKIAIFHRVTYDRYIESLIRSLLDQGSIPLLDTDDLTFDPQAFQWINSPDFQDPIRSALYKEDMRRNRQTLEACFGGLTSTTFLADQIRATGKPAWIHHNGYSLEMLHLSQTARMNTAKTGGKIILGYASGTPTHDRDFEIIKPVIRNILQKEKKAEFWFVGPLNPGRDWGTQSDQIKHLPLVPWRQLPAVLAQFDINLAPLVLDNPFTKAKSEIKFMEAALVGIPTIASSTPAFNQAIKNGENGFLASSPTDWAEKLELLMQNSDLRQKIGDGAFQDVSENDHPLKRAVQIINILEQVMLNNGIALQNNTLIIPSHNSVEVPPEGFLPPKIESHPTLVEMAFYTFRHRGLLTLLKQYWIYFRRTLAPVIPYRSKKSSSS